jgi:hypothetical protein
VIIRWPTVRIATMKTPPHGALLVSEDLIQSL